MRSISCVPSSRNSSGLMASGAARFFRLSSLCIEILGRILSEGVGMFRIPIKRSPISSSPIPPQFRLDCECGRCLDTLRNQFFSDLNGNEPDRCFGTGVSGRNLVIRREWYFAKVEGRSNLSFSKGPVPCPLIPTTKPQPESLCRSYGSRQAVAQAVTDGLAVNRPLSSEVRLEGGSCENLPQNILRAALSVVCVVSA